MDIQSIVQQHANTYNSRKESYLMARLSEVLPDWESLPKRLLAKRLTANHYISAKQTDYFLDGKPFASVRDFEVDFKGDSLTIRG